MTRSDLFRGWLSSADPILADGAMGTMLHSKGAEIYTCFDELNLLHPEWISQIHRDYVTAGAQILETNTFGANRFKLAHHGLVDRLVDINAHAVKLAREAAETSPRDVLIAGSVGPLGVRIAPLGRIKREKANQVYREQISALLQAGVDLIIIETQNDLHEILEAVQAAKSLSDIPVIATMTFTRDDRTLLGDTPAHVAELLSKSGADVIGANCSEGPAQMLRLLKKMKAAAPQASFSVMPNAGWPERMAGRILYPASAEYFADYTLAFVQAGATIVGGCCGTTPEHSSAIRQALDASESPRVKLNSISISEEISPAESEEHLTRMATKLGEGRFVFGIEMDPPRGYATQKLIAGAQLLKEAGADVINVADSPMARMRMSPWAACQVIQSEVGIETVLHFPTRGRNLLRVQGDLLAAHAIGIRNVFVVMGDPTAIGDYPEAMDDYDVVPSGLIKLISQSFNVGLDHAGSKLGDSTSFFIGCALNLGTKKRVREMRVLNRKVKAGAKFALTQPVYDPATVTSFIDEYTQQYGPLDLSILVGLLPLQTARHASFLHNEVPGIEIPESIFKRMHSSGKASKKEGIRIAINLLEELHGVVRGAYLMPAFGQYDVAAEIIERYLEDSLITG
jgi:methionine synthase I (cobalamin-dependent)/5,10-methylenetetrahydrofolate reductase